MDWVTGATGPTGMEALWLPERLCLCAVCGGSDRAVCAESSLRGVRGLRADYAPSPRDSAVASRLRPHRATGPAVVPWWCAGWPGGFGAAGAAAAPPVQAPESGVRTDSAVITDDSPTVCLQGSNSSLQVASNHLTEAHSGPGIPGPRLRAGYSVTLLQSAAPVLRSPGNRHWSGKSGQEQPTI
jgi:hypothetical protein